ncbi:hypothetical protein OEA41_007340 [Lepraria neglecta]|uniref:Uncharacterized protein n=1 Tax=Lepraria neglecta TaxID=209136 RepID=A0AAD9ZDH9_9LECA|nr:hypothetical protein OEA41_007340 [Lepraria neglecta]
MSNPVKTYFLSPGFEFPPPPDGLISLGSLLVEPKKPERSLNKNKQVPVLGNATYKLHKENWKIHRPQLRDARGGVWAGFLKMIVRIGGNNEINRSHRENEIYKCKRLETQSFQLDDSYIYESLQNPRVKSYIEQGWFKKPVYMITGLKIARGVSAEATESKGNGVDGELGVDATATGIPVSGGPKAKWMSKTNEDMSFTGSSDFVFAFQLIKISSRK